jgi:hypothetical protein
MEEFDNYNYDDFYHDHSPFKDDPDTLLRNISTPEIAAIENVEAYRPMTDEEYEKVWKLKRKEWNRLYGKENH